MKWWNKLRKRRRLDQDLAEEIEFHRLMRQRDSDAPDFGNPTLIKETMRDMWTFGWIETLFYDLKNAIRGMRHAPVFSVTVVLLLMLSIGGNTAMFAVFKSVLLDPLPYPDSDRLVRILHFQKKQALPFSVTAEDYLDWSRQTRRFDRLAAYTGSGMTLTGDGDPELITAVQVSANFFDVIGVQPALGRALRDGENEKGRSRVVILSHRLWQRRYNGDRGVIGRTVRANGEPYEIIGVMPRGFTFPDERFEAWSPLVFKGGDPQWINRFSHFLRVIGHLRPGETLASATAEMDAIASQLEQQFPDTNRNTGVQLRPLKESIVGDSRTLILLLYSAVGVLLLIACSNVASLLIARTAARRNEFAVRAALGAGRWRLLAQVATETSVLALLGGVAGLAFAAFLIELLKINARQLLPRIDDIALDGTVAAVSLGVSLLAGLALGTLPSLNLTRFVLAVRGVAASAVNPRLRSALVVGQLALAVVLLTGAGLILRSFQKLLSTDLGFDRDSIITMNAVLMETSYPDAARLLNFGRQLDERLAATPGLVAAGFSTNLPLIGQGGWGNPVTIFDRQAPPGKPFNARIQCVSPRFMTALGSRLRAGRLFEAGDDERGERVAIVDERFVKNFLNDGKSPIGRRVRLGGSGDGPDAPPWVTIVGVIAETRQETIEAAPEPRLYFPYAQLGDLARMVGRGYYIVGRTGVESAGAIGQMKSQIAALDPNLPVRDIRWMTTVVDSALAPHRVRAVIMSSFAALALVLAGVGLYGVIAYGVTQRKQEIGVRMALGARAQDIRRMVLGGGLRLTAAGLAIGIAASLLLSGLMDRLLFGVGSKDTVTLVAVGLLLAGIALLASYLPARRAARVDPMQALRTE